MEVRIYNASLDLQGIIENQTSLLWNRKFFEPGTFELHAPITSFNLSRLTIGNLITLYGQNDAGIIENIEYEESNDKNEITASGRFLSGYLGYRLIVGTVNLDGPIEVAMRTLFSNSSAIPLVELGTLNGYTETVIGQVTNKNLLNFINKLARAGNIGYRFSPDFNSKKII